MLLAGWNITEDGRIPGLRNEYPLWNCADIDAVNKSLKAGAKLGNDIEIHCVFYDSRELTSISKAARSHCMEILRKNGVRLTNGITGDDFGAPKR